MEEQQQRPGQDAAFLKLAEGYKDVEDDSTRKDVGRQRLEEVLTLFFKKGGISQKTYQMRIYMLWYRYGRSQGISLERWSESYQRGLLVGKSMFIQIENEPFIPYMRMFLFDFINDQVEEIHRLGVLYAIYYIVGLLLQAEVFTDDEIWEKLLLKQAEITRSTKREDFISIVSEMSSLLYAYILALDS